MKRTLLVCLVLSLWAGAAMAQSSNGYVFFAPGTVTGGGGVFDFGGGAEAILGKIVGVGGELSAITSTHFTGIVGLADVNGYGHFIPNRHSRFDPFVTAGYSLMFRDGHMNLFNVGGGMNYWFRKTVGLRVEFRDHILRDSGRAEHYAAWRVGFSFRQAVD